MGQFKTTEIRNPGLILYVQNNLKYLDASIVCGGNLVLSLRLPISIFS